MKAWSIPGPLIAIVAAAGIAFYACGRERATDARPKVEPPKPQATAAKATAAASPISEDETGVLEMYDAMAASVEQEQIDCEVLSREWNTLIERWTPRVERWAAAQSQLSPSEKAASEQRLRDAAGERLQRVQRAMKVGLASCGKHPGFQEALRKLVELTPS